ncbi:MAG: lipopolysaccharide heptosyltransferase family protein [Alphaproteobacteria bacterium]|nr:lipopolysaccharide heptosyltransferase family protein [Alphaproteobacteria bacterium]
MKPTTAVIQPLPGIGDMVWHGPALHALAGHHGPILLVARPRSRARQLFAADPAIGHVEYLGRDRGALGKLAGLAHLVRLLGRHRPDRVYVLHHAARYALAAALAGVPERLGYGIGRQTLWLNAGAMLGAAHRNTFPLAKSRLFLEGLAIPVPELEPRLAVAATARTRLLARFAGLARPWVGLGVGASETWKRWPAPSFARLLADLDERLGGTRFVLGASDEADLVATIAEGRPNTVPVSDLPLDAVMALMAECAFFVGNDSGLLNLAAALGITAFGLFGATPPLAYTSRLRAILPPGGQPGQAGGMAGIAPDRVLDALESVLKTTS